MSNALNYPYLLAVHTACADGQLHQKELHLLQAIAEKVRADAASEDAAQMILAQANGHLTLAAVLQGILPAQRMEALSLAAIAAHFEGALNRTERRFLERIKQQWGISDELFARILILGEKEAQRFAPAPTATPGDDLSTGAKVLSGLETVLGQKVVDRVVSTLGTACYVPL